MGEKGVVGSWIGRQWIASSWELSERMGKGGQSAGNAVATYRPTCQKCLLVQRETRVSYLKRFKSAWYIKLCTAVSGDAELLD